MSCRSSVSLNVSAPYYTPLSICQHPPISHLDYGISSSEKLSKSYGVKLVFYCLVEALTDAIGLWGLRLRPGVVDVFNSQIELVLVSLLVAAVFRAPVRQDTQQLDAMFLIPGDDPVIEHIGGHQDILAVIELDEGYLGIGVDEGLLVDSTYTFQRADIVVCYYASMLRPDH